MTEHKSPSYWDYLRLPDLLSLQTGLGEGETELLNDELHFIVVHQAFELWFKLTLAEMRQARDQLAVPHVPEQDIPRVVHHLRRINTILRLCSDQFEVMETLTPQDFLAFRDKLIPASGFQSFQLREIELAMGLEPEQREDAGFGDPMAAIRKLATTSPAGAYAVARLEAAESEGSIRAALHDWLHRTPIQGSEPGDPGDEAHVDLFLQDYLGRLQARGDQQQAALVAAGVLDLEGAGARIAAGQERARAFLMASDIQEGAEQIRRKRIRAAVLFIESYRELPLLAWPRLLLDKIVEMEEMLLLFRSRHARMVERIIGRRVGTGGSAGVEYLDKTTRYRVFTDLWAVRTLLLPRSDLAELEHPSVYFFAEGEG